jgi:hypothetical protein
VSKRHSIACLFQDLCPFWVVHWVRAKNVVCIFGTKRIYRFLILNRSSWGDKPQKNYGMSTARWDATKMPPMFSTQQNNPNFAWWLVCSVGAAWSKDAARKPNSGHHAPRFSEGQWKARRLKTAKKKTHQQSISYRSQSPQLKMIGWIIWFDTCTYQYVHTYTLYVLICVYISIHIIYIYIGIL